MSRPSLTGGDRPLSATALGQLHGDSGAHAPHILITTLRFREQVGFLTWLPTMILGVAAVASGLSVQPCIGSQDT
jgi:hypothetical protein